ncbi:unnamed protein product [Pneumocystis jirovecii]|uniref:RecA family profile 1 domain-containing protein n=1 Tax=Pneumocystis jirovecii TaxID=42068 RepID=L0PDK1_PNEJI|nr:unnamed protein product [Pneumocystis jirovecii]
MSSPHVYLSSLYHRLPTTSAFDALTSDNTLSFISSSISELDKIFGGNGFRTGQITEISGPPGSGKTTMALQATINCLKKREKILWIETFQPFPMNSLKRIMMLNKKTKKTTSIDNTYEDIDPLNYLTILHAPSLSNLIALFLHSYNTESRDLTQQKKLIVIDDIATPIIAAFPADNFENQSRNTTYDIAQLKKSQILANLLVSFNRIAAKNNASILVLSKMVIKINILNGRECPILSSPLSPVWSQNCPNRILLLRKNIIFENTNNSWNNTQVRFISIQKVSGVTINSNTLIPFIITDKGIHDITNNSNDILNNHDQIEFKNKTKNTNENEYNKYN